MFCVLAQSSDLKDPSCSAVDERMEVGIEAARWVVGKALGPAAGEVLEAWAASSELGTNIRALRMELLYA